MQNSFQKLLYNSVRSELKLSGITHLRDLITVWQIYITFVVIFFYLEFKRKQEEICSKISISVILIEIET